MTDDLVHLRGGLVVSRGAVELLWRLEQQGVAVVVRNDKLDKAAARLASTATQAAIKAHETELVALVLYCEDVRADLFHVDNRVVTTT